MELIRSLLTKFSFYIFQVETFNLSVPHETADDLSDGIAMAQVLNQM